MHAVECRALVIRKAIQVVSGGWIFLNSKWPTMDCYHCINVIPRVLRLFGQQLVTRRDLTFLIGSLLTACIVLLQKSCGNKIPVPRVSPGNQSLAKEPEDSGYEIDHLYLSHTEIMATRTMAWLDKQIEIKPSPP